MKDSKLFIAGIVAFALALGVILGNFCSKNSACCCQKADMSQCMRQGMTPPPPPGPHGDFHKDHRPHGDFHKGHKHRGKAYALSECREVRGMGASSVS